jgi:hypothetical protein
MTQKINLRRLVALLCLTGALGIAIAGCGSSSSSTTPNGGSAAAGTTTSASTSSTQFAKTKFVLHAGLAFGAFHRWIYKPLKAGTLQHPLTHKLTAIKAVLAGAFVVHEVRLALAAAKADPTLSKLVAPITGLEQKLSAAVSGIKSGNVDAASLEGVQSLIGSVKDKASSAGQSITEQTPSSL